MGRHGGGSRSGGSRGGSRSRSGSGSRSGGSSGIRTSKKPFRGCYNRSYYHRGRYYPYYTSDPKFGTKKGILFSNIVSILFLTLHMLFMVGGACIALIHVGEKVDGNPERIQIMDEIDILSPQEEDKLIDLFYDIYDKSGMPITLITDDFEWKEHYENIEPYAEELYYGISMDEAAMLILFTQADVNGFTDWEYDMYCGDDTVKCLSDATFEKLLDTFQKSMAKQDLYYGLDYSWNAIMNDLAKTSFDPSFGYIMAFLLFLYGMMYYFTLNTCIKRRNAVKYFSKNPEMLNPQPMMVYNECPNCGAPNSTMAETCPYCGSVLRLSN